MLIFKIVPRTLWETAPDPYPGSAHDQADGFLHFSTGPQLPETLRCYYAGQSDLLLIAVDDADVAGNLKYEYATSRDDDFPHLFVPLPHRHVLWVRPIGNDGDGFVLPALD